MLISDARRHEPSKERRVDNETAPLGVPGSSGFGRDEFLEAFALLLETRHVLAQERFRDMKRVSVNLHY